MGRLAASRTELERAWNASAANLEDELLIYDFFRREEGYQSERPFILCKDGGLMAVFTLDGLDPETLGADGMMLVSDQIRRGMDVFNPTSLEGQWRKGTWEVMQSWTRTVGKAPELAPPERKSEALRYLWESCNEHWQKKIVYRDEILWSVKFLPRFREAHILNWAVWSLRDPNIDVRLRREVLQAEARMMRRVFMVFEENMLAFTTRRPKMGFGLRWLNEDDAYAALWRQTNRRGGEPGPLRRDIPLLSQIACSRRDNSGEHYRIDGRPTKVLSWKIPPARTMGHLFGAIEKELRFPFTLTQTFRALDFHQIEKRIGLFGRLAQALTSHSGERYAAEAEDLLMSVRRDRATPFNWYCNAIVQGDNVNELEDRAIKLASQFKLIEGGEAQEEADNRVLAELSTVPGNGQYGIRNNIVTSKQVGDLAMVYRLSSGDPDPFMLFGDRAGGVWSYSLFTRGEPSWNKFVAGLPGSGKSILLNSLILGLAMRESQAYVLDKGNSFGPIFELLAQEMPDQVASMRLRGGDFRFNPLPMVWALEERERQKKAGTYRMILEGGGQVPCPVEDAELFFERWLDVLIGQGKPVDPGTKALLDRALRGRRGEGGFFLEYQNQCWSYIRRRSDLPPPRPLTSLLTHLRAEAPQFVPSVELWTRAPRSRFFDSGTDSISSAKYVLFELTGIEDDPLLVLPFVVALVGSIWRRIQDPAWIREKKGVFVEEFWSFGGPAFTPFVQDIARTGRKFGNLLALSSQTPNDLSQGEARKLLQTMSETFLYKGFSEPQFMQEDLQLQPHQLELHRSLREDEGRREVYYVSGRGMNRVLSVEIPPVLYWFATTDPEDKQWRALFWKRFGLRGGVEHLVRACEGRTIASPRLRLEKVKKYAETIGLSEAKTS